MIKKLICYTFCILAIAACAIENDIPYPIVDGSILDITVEGQCAAEGSSSSQATIDKNSYTVKLYVDDIDGNPTRTFDEFYANCIGRGIVIPWRQML